MIEEKLKEVLNGLIPLCGTANIEPRIEDILSICKSEIAEATSETYSNGFTYGYNSCCESFKPMIAEACKKAKIEALEDLRKYLLANDECLVIDLVDDKIIEAKTSPLDEVKQ